MAVEFDEQKSAGIAYRSPANSPGIIGFLMRKRVVRDESQANVALLIVSLISLAVAAYLFWSVFVLDSGVTVNQGVQTPPLPAGMSTSSLLLQPQPRSQ